MTVDLSTMTPRQLLELQADAATALATKADNAVVAKETIDEFAADLKRLAEKWTAKAATMVAAQKPPAANGNGATKRVVKRTGKPAVKFRDKDGHSWSGRGKQPRWLKAAVAGGRSIDEFRVQA